MLYCNTHYMDKFNQICLSGTSVIREVNMEPPQLPGCVEVVCALCLSTLSALPRASYMYASRYSTVVGLTSLRRPHIVGKALEIAFDVLTQPLPIFT